MKFSYTRTASAVALTTLILGGLAACGGSSSSSTPAATPGATLKIRVVDTEKQPVAGATVKDGTKTVLTTDDKGEVSLALEADAKGSVLIEKDDYMGQTRDYKNVPSGSTTSTEVMIKKRVLVQANVDFSDASNNPVKVTHAASSAAVKISNGNAWVTKGDKAPYSGPVNVYMAPIDVSNDSTEERAFPRPYAGITAAQANDLVQNDASVESLQRGIVSYGMADFTFETTEGEELDLAEGVTAEIDIPLTSLEARGGNAALQTNEKRHMWWFDYERKTWVQNDVGDGQGTVVELNPAPTDPNAATHVLRGEVNHFTPWNCDAFGSLANISTRVWCGDTGDDKPTFVKLKYVSNGQTGEVWSYTGQDDGIVFAGYTSVTASEAACPGHTEKYSKVGNITISNGATGILNINLDVVK